MKTKRGLLVVLCLLSLGCPMVDSAVLQGFREYFPQATLSKPRADVLHVETNAAGVSKAFCSQLFISFSKEPDFARLESGFRAARYAYLTIGVGENVIVWARNLPQQFRVISRQEFNSENWQSAGVPQSTNGASLGGMVLAAESAPAQTTRLDLGPRSLDVVDLSRIGGSSVRVWSQWPIGFRLFSNFNQANTDFNPPSSGQPTNELRLQGPFIAGKSFLRLLNNNPQTVAVWVERH